MWNIAVRPSIGECDKVSECFKGSQKKIPFSELFLFSFTEVLKKLLVIIENIC